MNNSIQEAIKQTLKETDFLHRAFPAFQQWGVRDEDVMVHSLGVSAWNTLGYKLGFQAIVECPAPAAIGDDIRSDSIWFDTSNKRPVVFIEFERYDGTTTSKVKLHGKLFNLMEAAHRWQNPSALLVLIAWNKGIVSAPDVEAMTRTMRQGFKNSKGVNIPGRASGHFLFCRFLMDHAHDNNLRLQDILFRENL